MKRYLIPFLTAVLFVTVAAGCPGPTPPPPPPAAPLIVTRVDTIPDGTFLVSEQKNARLLDFIVTNTSTELLIASMSISSPAGNPVTLNDIERLKLYNGDTLVSVMMPSPSSTSFDVNYAVPAQSTRGFSFYADFGETATGTFQFLLTNVKTVDPNGNVSQSLNGANTALLSPTNPINSAQFRFTP